MNFDWLKVQNTYTFANSSHIKCVVPESVHTPTKKPSVGGVWIFSGTTQYKFANTKKLEQKLAKTEASYVCPQKIENLLPTVVLLFTHTCTNLSLPMSLLT